MMAKKQVRMVVMLLASGWGLFFCGLHLSAIEDSGIAEYTMLVYVQAQNNLESFARKNLSDMAMVGSNKRTNILVQWYQPGKKGIWRYRIDKGQAVLVMNQASDTDGTRSTDLVDAARWAVKNYPSKKFALILWDHGLGVVDPVWGNHRPPFQEIIPFTIDPSYLINNPRIQIEGLTVEEEQDIQDILSLVDPCAGAEEMFDNAEAYDRSILFNEYTKTYMDNESLCQALSEIKRDVLGNRKIDLLGMDACLMAMVEVAYMVRDYAKVLVASEEVELAQGWDYAALCYEMAERSMTPVQLGNCIVQQYERYYKDKIQFYTQSAVDLAKMVDLKRNADILAQSVKNSRGSDAALVGDCIRRARRACLQFSAHSYIDFHSFCKELVLVLEQSIVKKQGNISILNTLRQQAAAVMTAIEAAIISCTTGKNLADAKGLSIYFPLHHIDSSYTKTDFVKDTAWLDVIKSNLN